MSSLGLKMPYLASLAKMSKKENSVKNWLSLIQSPTVSYFCIRNWCWKSWPVSKNDVIKKPIWQWHNKLAKTSRLCRVIGFFNLNFVFSTKILITQVRGQRCHPFLMNLWQGPWFTELDGNLNQEWFAKGLKLCGFSLFKKSSSSKKIGGLMQWQIHFVACDFAFLRCQNRN